MSTFRRTLATAVAAAGLLVSTAAAAANPAARLSVAPAARASAPAGTSKIAPGSTATLISVGLLVAFTAVVLATTGGDGGSGGKPSSP